MITDVSKFLLPMDAAAVTDFGLSFSCLNKGKAWQEFSKKDYPEEFRWKSSENTSIWERKPNGSMAHKLDSVGFKYFKNKVPWFFNCEVLGKRKKFFIISGKDLNVFKFCEIGDLFNMPLYSRNKLLSKQFFIKKWFVAKFLNYKNVYQRLEAAKSGPIELSTVRKKWSAKLFKHSLIMQACKSSAFLRLLNQGCLKSSLVSKIWLSREFKEN